MSAGVSDYPFAEPVSTKPGARRVRIPIIEAAPADHAAIFYFLQSVFNGPSRGEFKAALGDPFYEPSDRLLIRRGRKIIAHAHVTHRVMHFGRLQIPVAGLGWLGVAAASRGQGLGRHLLLAAEKQMARAGALIGLLRTDIPYFFRRTGWALCGRHNYSRANARAIIAKLLERHGCRRKHRPPLFIRPWRRWEEGGLVRVYNNNLGGAFGPLQRTDAYWHWLIRRHAFDQLYVALEGPDQWDLEEASTRIVGYAMTRGEQIVEIMTEKDCRRALRALVARVCRDAIELDRQCVLLHAPPSHSMHELFLNAGGIHHYHEADRGEVYMARLLEPLKLLRSLSPEFLRRSVKASLPLPLELGLMVEGRKYSLEIAHEEVKVTARRIGRSYLRLNVADFTRLVLGELDWDRARAEGRLEVSTQLAERAGRALFPNVPVWRPPLDDLQV
jgi:predicted acetyltransferase